jgi:hypothetical protein
MMCAMSNASNGDGRAKAAKVDTGVLANLPRTRPQRSSPRRAAARREADAPAGASSTTQPTTTKSESAPKGKPARASTEKHAPKAKPARAPTEKHAPTRKPAQAERADGRTSARSSSGKRKRDARERVAGTTPRQEPAPRQGFESEGDNASGPVQPPGATELVSSAAELAGELAKAGVTGGARLLKDLFSRLPPG